MRTISLMLRLLAAVLLSISSPGEIHKEVELYRWVDFEFSAPGAASGITRWDVAGTCTWTHTSKSGTTQRTSLVWYSGNADTYVFRFGASLPGRWTGKTRSPISKLDGHELRVTVLPPTNPNRTGWSGSFQSEPTAWAHQKGPEGKLAKRTPILIMMPDVQRWHDDHSIMRKFVAEFNENHGFNGGHISTIGHAWFDASSSDDLSKTPATPDIRTFAALETAAREWSDRGGWLHLWMWGKGDSGDFAELPGGYNGPVSRRINRYLAARLGPVPGWSLGLGWDVEFWADEQKLKWWLDEIIPNLGGWHHWVGHRYSDSDIGRGHDPEPANKGEYLERGIKWNTLRPGTEQYAGWEHWATTTSDAALDAARKVFADRPMLSEDRFRQRQGAWRQKDMRADDDILREIPRWATRGIGAIYGRLLEPGTNGSEPWPNKAEIKALITKLERDARTKHEGAD